MRQTSRALRQTRSPHIHSSSSHLVRRITVTRAATPHHIYFGHHHTHQAAHAHSNAAQQPRRFGVLDARWLWMASRGLLTCRSAQALKTSTTKLSESEVSEQIRDSLYSIRYIHGYGGASAHRAVFAVKCGRAEKCVCERVRLSCQFRSQASSSWRSACFACSSVYILPPKILKLCATRCQNKRALKDIVPMAARVNSGAQNAK